MSRSITWHHAQTVEAKEYRCWNCGLAVASEKGLSGEYLGNNHGAFVVLCPSCDAPTFLRIGLPQVPGTRGGNDVAGVEDKSVLDLYNEARDCTAAGAFTACLLCCRKVLMHLAVSRGAKENLSFAAYVDFLANSGFVPPDGKEWVDHIRSVGNDANHEIMIAPKDLAEEVLSFVEMLLKFVYEFPHRVRARRAPGAPTT